MDFTTTKSYLTPLKARKCQIDQGDVDAKVLDQSHCCTGFPYEVLCQDEASSKKDSRRECHICRSKTKWQCVNCHLYFCMASKKNNKQEGQCYFIKEKESVDSDKKVTCVYGTVKVFFFSKLQTKLQVAS